MTATSGIQLSVGLRHASVFALNASGYPAATSASVPYEGLEFGGPRAFDLNVPDLRRISHVGNDRVLALDFLPPTEGMTGELRIARHEQAINAALMSVNQFTVGEAKMVPWATDEQGNEENFAMMLFQQSLDGSNKLRRWRFIMMPSVRIVPQIASMNENPSENRYMVAPNPSTKHIWGTSLIAGTEGATEAAAIEGMAEGRPKIIAFLGDNSATIFTLPTGKPAISTSKFVVWKDGVLQTLTTHYTVTTTAVTFVTAPGTNALVVIYYEY